MDDYLAARHAGVPGAEQQRVVVDARSGRHDPAGVDDVAVQRFVVCVYWTGTPLGVIAIFARYQLPDTSSGPTGPETFPAPDSRDA